MISVKVVCVCGQKYAFDVQPYNGRMPAAVHCPVCGVDGTASANEIIARTLAAQPAPVAAVESPAPAPVAPPPAKTAKAVEKKSKSGWLIYAIIGVATVAMTAAIFVWLKHPAATATEPRESRIAVSQPSRTTVLPPEAVSFIDAKEKQAEELAQLYNFQMPDAAVKFFAAAKSGKLAEAQQAFADLRKNAAANTDTNAPGNPLVQVACDVELCVEAFGADGGDADLVLALARAMTNSLTAGCIYFGGTDPGRGLPTMLCHSPGDPFFVISQNPLADAGYMELLRAEYGDSLQIPTTDDIAACRSNYLADVQSRAANGKLRPGENFRIENGQPKVQGQVAVMNINALIAKTIFDKNPGHDFFYEESFPLDWMYPYLTPHGLLMKVNRQPLADMPPEEIQRDEDFWSKETAVKIGGWLAQDTPVSDVCAFAEKVSAHGDLSDFSGDPKFAADKYSQKIASKLRSSIAGIYAWRLSPQCPPEYQPKNDAERQQLTVAADFAFRQALALCPYSSEAVFRYINFLVPAGRFDDAILIANTDLDCLQKNEPGMDNSQIKSLISQLQILKKTQ